MNVITTTSFSNAGTDASPRRIVTALTNQSNGRIEAYVQTFSHGRSHQDGCTERERIDAQNARVRESLREKGFR